MNKDNLQSDYPLIAKVFEGIILNPSRRNKYRHEINNYENPKRGISFEKIFSIFKENGLTIKIEKAKWFN